MKLSSELISQFVKATKDTKKDNRDTTVRGTVVLSNGGTFVKLEGSDRLTPVETTTAVKPGERVNVLIKDHSATITGNVTDPSASAGSVSEFGTKITNINDSIAHTVKQEEINAIKGTFDELIVKMASIDKLTAVTAEVETLKAKYATLDKVTANEANILNADIEHLEASVAEIQDLDVEDLNAVNAYIAQIKAYNGEFTYVSAQKIAANKAEIDELKSNKVDTEYLTANYADINRLNAEYASIEELNAAKATISNLGVTYATIDFANIGEAALRKIYADSGIIDNIQIKRGVVSGELVGVTISGDLIKGNTIMADKLVVRGSDGLYYKLNYESGALNGEGISRKAYYIVDWWSDPKGRLIETDEELDIDTITDTEYAGNDSTDGNPVYMGYDSNGDIVAYVERDVYPDWVDKQLHGSNIVAKSITAEQLTVSDLVAFDATIGNFNIQKNADGLGAIHSITKQSVDSPLQGIFMQSDGQFNVGDDSNYIKYIKNENGEYKLVISAESILYNLNGGNRSLSDVGLLTDYVRIGIYEYDEFVSSKTGPTLSRDDDLEEINALGLSDTGMYYDHNGPTPIYRGVNSDGDTVYYIYSVMPRMFYKLDRVSEPCIEIGSNANTFKMVITNTKIMFIEGSHMPAYISNDSLHIDKAVIDNELSIGEFVWKKRANGNVGLIWKENIE